MGLDRRILCASVLIALGLASPARAEDYPTRPVVLVSPFAAGGTSDAVARVLGRQMAETLGQPVVVENVTGAGGTIGVANVARAEPDGYRILMGGLGSVVLTAGIYGGRLAYAPQRDLAAIASIALVPTVVAVNADLPVRTLRELVDYAKARPDELSFGSPGVGSSLHLAGELFMKLTGAELVHVPYRGAAPAMTDLLGGRIPLLFTDTTQVLPHLPGDRLRVLAVAGPERDPFLPDVPTTAEAGYPDLVVETWYGLLAPGGTPRPVLAKLADAANLAIRSEAVQASFASQGMTAAPREPAAFAAGLRDDFARWLPFIEQLDIQQN